MFRVFAAAALVLLLLCQPLLAANPSQRSAKPSADRTSSAPLVLKRDVLGLYDGRSEQTAKLSRLHKYLEMPLNHLGYRLTLHDISKGLPPLDTVARYHAIATWFSGEIAEGKSFVLWAARAARNGTRFVVLDSVGLLGSADELPSINAFLGELGIAYVEYYVSNSRETRILASDEMIGFESKLDPLTLPDHQVVVVKNPRTTVHLSVTDPGHRAAHARFSALVTTNAKGGFATTNYVMQHDQQTDITRWIIDPFAFLEAALGSGARPIPDTTTISGRRIYFSHVDGDGWNNATTVQPYSERRETSAAVLLDKLIAPYPDLPVTVGLIAGDADPVHGGTPHAADIARRIFALRQVEPASHTFTHPYDWTFYAGYRRSEEIARVLRFADVEPSYDDRSLATLVRQWREQFPRNSIASAEPTAPQDGKDHDATLPRARPQQPFDLALEVKGAIARTARLAPSSKPPKLYLWSGDTTPFEGAVKAAREAGTLNLNGGDSRLDTAFPSVAYVPPVGVAVGSERQVYAVNSNENTYTNGWTGPFDAFKLLVETLDNTERPRRLKAFNLYYHSFSATRPEGIEAVSTHLERARRDPVAPIKASQYAAIANGFYSAEIVPAGPLRWRITSRGALDTVRFDRADAITIDYAASSGVVGHNRHQGSLYVALDGTVTEPVIAMMAINAATVSQARPHLIESRWLVSSIDHQPCRTTAIVQGYGSGTFSWAGFPPGSYIVKVDHGTKARYQQQAMAGTSGTLAFTVPIDAVDPLSLTISCVETDVPAHSSGKSVPREPRKPTPTSSSKQSIDRQAR